MKLFCPLPTLKSFHIPLCIWLGWAVYFFTSIDLKAQVGPNNEYFLVKDLSKDWIVYDKDLKEYVPYVAEQHSGQLVNNVLLDLESNRYYDLLIYVEKDNFLFFNSALKENLKANQWRVIHIDSLHKVYQTHRLLISVYGTNALSGKKIFIAHRRSSTTSLETITQDSPLVLKTIEKSPINNFFVLALFCLMAYSATLFNGSPRAFERMYSLFDTLRTDIKDETFLINRPLSRVNLFFIALLSLELAYLFIFLQSKQHNIFPLVAPFTGEESFWSTSWLFVSASVIVFGALVGKYFVLYQLSTLYRLEKVANLHFFKAIQADIIYFSGLLIVTVTASVYIYDWNTWAKPLVIIPTIVFYVFRTLLIFLAIRNTVSIKNLYLISYLCVVEVIPIIIGIRYVL